MICSGGIGRHIRLKIDALMTGFKSSKAFKNKYKKMTKACCTLGKKYGLEYEIKQAYDSLIEEGVDVERARSGLLRMGYLFR